MVEYKYERESNTIHVHVEGVLTVDDAIGYFRKLKADKSVEANATERVDFTKLDDIQFSYTTVLTIIDEYNLLKQARRIGETVFVVDSDLSYGMARMLKNAFMSIQHKVTIVRDEVAE